MEGEVTYRLCLQNIKRREGFYHKAHKVVDGYNLSAKKLQEYCLED